MSCSSAQLASASVSWKVPCPSGTATFPATFQERASRSQRSRTVPRSRADRTLAEGLDCTDDVLGDVIPVLDPDREPDQAVVDAELPPAVLAEVAMRSGRGMRDQ